MIYDFRFSIADIFLPLRHEDPKSRFVLYLYLVGFVPLRLRG